MDDQRYDAQRTASIRPIRASRSQTMQKPGDFGPFKFLWKLKLEYDPKAATALTQPILLDRIIGFRGFKSIAFVGDAVGNRARDRLSTSGTPLWKYHVNYSASPPPMLNVTSECPGGLVAPLSRPTAFAPAAAGGGGGGGGRGGGRAAASANRAKARHARDGGPAARRWRGGAPARTWWPRGRSQVPFPDRRRRPREHAGWSSAGARAGGGGGGFGGGPFVPGNDAAYVVGSDGFLHALNVQNGVDLMPPTLFIPANTRAAGLLIATGPTAAPSPTRRRRTAAAASRMACGRWSSGSEKKDVVAFQPKDATIAGSAGFTLGSRRHRLRHDHERFVVDVESAHRARTENAEAEGRGDCRRRELQFVAARLCRKDKDIRRATGGGKLYLFDSAALASGPIATAAVAGTEKFEPGALASWEDAQNVRWIAVPSSRGIVTFKVADDNGKLALQPGLDLARHRFAAAAARRQWRALHGVERHQGSALRALRDRRLERQGTVEQHADDYDIGPRRTVGRAGQRVRARRRRHAVRVRVCDQK